MKKITLGVIVGNRGFFPDALAQQGRKNIMAVLKDNGYNAVALKLNDTKLAEEFKAEHQNVDTDAEPRRLCLRLFNGSWSIHSGPGG